MKGHEATLPVLLEQSASSFSDGNSIPNNN
jgi:hypothetical protein